VQRQRELKALKCQPILAHFFRKELQRDMPTKPKVLSLVDHTHPSATDLLNNAV
jgi:hypothetical protein